MQKGKIIVISGPSGVGKNEIICEFINDEDLNLTQSISMTSRPRRSDERDGIDYDFVSREYFETAIKEDKFIEHTEFLNNYYGTCVDSVERLMNMGKNVIIEVEASGAKKIKAKYPNCLCVFVTPSSMDALEKSIRSRRVEDEAVVLERLAKAKEELNLISTYRFVVNNDDVKLAGQISALIIKRYI